MKIIKVQKVIESILFPVLIYVFGLLTTGLILGREFVGAFVVTGIAFAYMILTSKILYKHFTSKEKTK